MRNGVVALYVDELGPYPELANVLPFQIGIVDWYDVTRDARGYTGPWPIVAHPPCGPWSKLRHLYEGAEHDCALRAVEQVRTFGGVLEHPAGSKLWDALELPRPSRETDAFGGYTIEVCQSDFGHVARKRTWLYIVGVPRDAITLPPRREPTHWASGSRGKSSRRGAPVPPGIKVCSAQQRRRTPRAFAEWLISLAALAGSVERKEST